MIKSFDELAQEAKERISSASLPKMGIVYPKAGKCLEAAVKASEDGYAQPFLIGSESVIEKGAADAGLDISRFDIIDTDSIEASVKKGIEMVKAGELQFLLKGSIGTKELVDILLKPETGFIIPGHAVSHVGILHTPRYHKLMFVTDAAVNAQSDAGTMINIARNASAVARLLGIETPRAALLAAVEAIYPAVPVTMMEAAIAKMSDRGQIKDVLIDGPLSFDVATDAEVARSKGMTKSEVAGEADIFVGPSMETANGVYKAMVLYAGAEAAGMIFGGLVPIVSTFVVDPVKHVVNSIILGAYITAQ
jgi:phosphate acetyltransferase